MFFFSGNFIYVDIKKNYDNKKIACYCLMILKWEIRKTCSKYKVNNNMIVILEFTVTEYLIMKIFANILCQIVNNWFQVK